MSSLLLIRPEAPLIHPLPFGEQAYPLGMGCLISCLRRAGHEVGFIDRYLDRDARFSLDIINNYDIVGFSCDSATFRSALRLMDKVQCWRDAGKWKGRIVVGGPHASVMPEMVPDCVDHVVIGEGEQVLCRIADGEKFERVINAPRIQDLDALPFPAYDVFDGMPYGMRTGPGVKTANMSASRGCSRSCRFCPSGRIWGRRVTAQSAERMAADAERLCREFGVGMVRFHEDNFLADKKRAIEFAESLLKRGLPMAWNCGAQVDDLLDEGFVKTLKKSGLKSVSLGIGSLNQRVSDLMGKKTTVGQAWEAVANCRRCGVTPYGSFTVGVPGETDKERQETIIGAGRMFPDGMLAVEPFCGMPSSPMYEDAINQEMDECCDMMTGSFYMENHDALCKETAGEEPPVWRRNPAPFMASPDNANSVAVEACEGDDAIVINNPHCDSGWEPARVYWMGLADMQRTLWRGGVKRFVLNNMLHLVAKDDLPELLAVLKARLAEGGKVVGWTVDRGEMDLREACMRNFPAEHVWNSVELETALGEAGFFSPVYAEGGTLSFEAELQT